MPQFIILFYFLICFKCTSLKHIKHSSQILQEINLKLYKLDPSFNFYTSSISFRAAYSSKDGLKEVKPCDRPDLISLLYGKTKQQRAEVIFCTLSVHLTHWDRDGNKKAVFNQMGLYSKVVTYFFL